MHCIAMPTDDESVCCREITKVLQIVEEFNSETTSCITQHPGFEAGCLNVWTLQIAYLQYRQHYGVLDKPLHQ
jgi:hypothetical protein